MNEFEVVTVIGRPIEEVFAVLREVTKTPVWTPGLSQVRRTSDGPLGVGATMVYEGTFLGRHYESPVVCTSFAENKQFATATTAGPFQLEVDQTLEPAATGTKLTIRYRGESRGFFRLAEPPHGNLRFHVIDLTLGQLVENRALEGGGRDTIRAHTGGSELLAE